MRSVMLENTCLVYWSERIWIWDSEQSCW